MLNDILDLCKFDLTYLTPPPTCQNFTGVICYITPVLNDILDLCKFDLTYLTPAPPLPANILQMHFHHVTPQLFNQIASSCSRHNKNHVLPKRSTMLKSISCFAKHYMKMKEIELLPPWIRRCHSLLKNIYRNI